MSVIAMLRKNNSSSDRGTLKLFFVVKRYRHRNSCGGIPKLFQIFEQLKGDSSIGGQLGLESAKDTQNFWEAILLISVAWQRSCFHEVIEVQECEEKYTGDRFDKQLSVETVFK